MDVGAWGVSFILLTLVPPHLFDSPCSEVAETEYHGILHQDASRIHFSSGMLEQRYGRQIPPMAALKSINTTCSNVTFDNGPLDMDMSQKRGCYSCQRTLTITSSEIPWLPAYAFSEFHETTDLYMTNVKMENISQGAFNVLHSIRALYLSDNNLENITDGVFNALRTLRILDLSSNNISTIDTTAFSKLYLNLLNISSNSLKTFNSEVLSEVTKIDDLNLSFNNLYSFDFIYMDKVNSLNLSNNYIRVIEGCFIELTTLDLSKNELNTLGDLNCFNSTSNLAELDISYNYISNLNFDLFSTLYKLECLHLEHNNISSIPNGCFSKLGSLTFLNLSSNNLVEFQYGLFDKLSDLDTLDISYNKLSSFKKHVFHSLRNLRYLYLQHNRIYYLSSFEFLRFLPMLLVVNLDGNNLTCDELIEIFNNPRLTVVEGKSFNTHNIHGIQCSNGSDNFAMHPLAPIHEKNVFMDYIEKEGANTLIGYLKKTENTANNELDIDNYFKNGSFYKYLEALTNQLKFYSKYNENITNYFNRDFRNSNFIKFLDSNFSQSAMYNNFINSSFYKYLESLRTSEYITLNGSGSKDFVGGFYKEINLDSNILVAITVLLIFIVCLLVVFLFVLYIKLSSHKDLKIIETDEVELLGA